MQEIKNLKGKVVLSILMVVVCIAMLCSYNAEINSIVIGGENLQMEDSEKCRQCGRQLRHKGYFCSENCRESYANEYHNERYGKAICRNCGTEFIKPTAYSYCCSPKCGYEYSEDIKLVGEAEEYRKSKDKVEAQ